MSSVQAAADATAASAVAGIWPAVAIALVEMGLQLGSARMARSLEAALAMLGGVAGRALAPAAGSGS